MTSARFMVNFGVKFGRIVALSLCVVCLDRAQATSFKDLCLVVLAKVKTLGFRSPETPEKSGAVPKLEVSPDTILVYDVKPPSNVAELKHRISATEILNNPAQDSLPQIRQYQGLRSGLLERTPWINATNQFFGATLAWSVERSTSIPTGRANLMGIIGMHHEFRFKDDVEPNRQANLKLSWLLDMANSNSLLKVSDGEIESLGLSRVTTRVRGVAVIEVSSSANYADGSAPGNTPPKLAELIEGKGDFTAVPVRTDEGRGYHGNHHTPAQLSTYVLLRTNRTEYNGLVERHAQVARDRSLLVLRNSNIADYTLRRFLSVFSRLGRNSELNGWAERTINSAITFLLAANVNSTQVEHGLTQFLFERGLLDLKPNPSSIDTSSYFVNGFPYFRPNLLFTGVDLFGHLPAGISRDSEGVRTHLNSLLGRNHEVTEIRVTTEGQYSATVKN